MGRAFRGDLRQVGDVYDLHRRRERFDDLSHGVGDTARNACVYFVEDDRRQLHAPGQQGFEGQHDAGQLTARSDPLDGLGRCAAVGHKEENHAVAACAAQFGERRERHFEHRVGHA